MFCSVSVSIDCSSVLRWRSQVCSSIVVSSCGASESDWRRRPRLSPFIVQVCRHGRNSATRRLNGGRGGGGGGGEGNGSLPSSHFFTLATPLPVFKTVMTCDSASTEPAVSTVTVSVVCSFGEGVGGGSSRSFGSLPPLGSVPPLRCCRF